SPIPRHSPPPRLSPPPRPPAATRRPCHAREPPLPPLGRTASFRGRRHRRAGRLARSRPPPPSSGDDRVGRGVAVDGQPATATGRVEPALGRHAVRVLEVPDLVDVAGVVAFDPVRHGPPLAAKCELVDRPATAARTGEPEH